MTKLFTILLLVTGFYTASFAQNSKGVEFGANIGYNGSYVEDSGSQQTSDVAGGFNVGVSADIYFSDRWSFKAKVIYDQKGWGNGFLIGDDGSEIDRVNFQLNYITIPLMANWHFGKTRNWYLHFGPYVGFLTSTSESLTNTDIKDAFNTTDFGLDLGIGVKFPISDRIKLFIEADGQSGVTNIFKDSGDGSFAQNARSSINFGISFPMR